VPTTVVYSTLDGPLARTSWRFLFLTQPAELPERLIGADPLFYLRWTLREWAGSIESLAPEAVGEYERCFDAATIHASCEDFRAGSTIELLHDGEDADRQITCPVLVLWSQTGLGSSYDVLGIWRGEAEDVRGHEIASGHFLAEERPDEVSEELAGFIAE
jgi:haloacetate dehalogenase